MYIIVLVPAVLMNTAPLHHIYATNMSRALDQCP